MSVSRRKAQLSVGERIAVEQAAVVLPPKPHEKVPPYVARDQRGIVVFSAWLEWAFRDLWAEAMELRRKAR